ncbi:MAG: hypothetical protein PHT02_00220 [Tissierellia bacterium]|nr:hypothetical protein [Tissierellia bacterium]
MSNKGFVNLDKIINKFMKQIEESVIVDLNKIGEEVKGVLRNNVRVLWYERNGMNWEPQDYERTYQLIDSITCKKVIKIGNKYQVEIFFDTDKIQPMYGTDDKHWTRHMSVVNYSDVSEAIPLWIEEGNNNSRIYSYEGVHPVQETKEWIKNDNYIKERLKELLEMQGYKVIG